MNSVESLISMHRKDMEFLRDESRTARKQRLSDCRALDQSFKELRTKLSADLPHMSPASKLRGAVTLMAALLGVLSY
ncbi:hypothetical protein [Maridesulfovibrio zosterae]|uniref:hypothetical protein n=1 Tax=Maridesulfovibrio zosterae TaxID=82171 RepID=UPI00041F6D5E|nr:hypothetical protein [Maridesulfovibrio zosterae]